MSIGLGVTRTYSATASANATAPARLIVPVVKPANVYRFGVINANATDIAAAFELELRHRVVGGDAGTDVTVATLSPDDAIVQGDGVWFDLPERLEVNPGSWLVLAVATVGGSTSAHFFIEVVEYPWQRTGPADVDRLGDMTKVT